ncbi:hypothetical protein QQ045_004140 [Rhodiola kirilowii]
MSTVVAPASSNPIEDAAGIHKACKGLGTDEKKLISILGHRTWTQRLLIREAYEKTYNEDLIKRLQSELSGDFERAVSSWVLDPADRDAVLAHIALRKGTSDFHVIVEIACVRSPEELLEVRRKYQLRYRLSLEEDVATHTTGNIRKLLVGLVSAFRYEGAEVNGKLARSEAEILQEDLKKKEFKHEEVIRILTTRSKTQLMATFNKYREDFGSSITKNMLANPSDEFLQLLRTAIRCINDPIKYYEKVLRNSMRMIGTDENALTRVIVTRAEKDLVMIKDVYYKRNSVNLEDAVAKETSGDYKAFLLTLLGAGNA